MALTITVDDKAMRRFVRDMPAAGRRTMARSMNKAITMTRTMAAREISGRRNILVGRAKKELRLQRASASRPVAAIHASGYPIPLIDVKGAKRQTKRGVVAKIEAGEPGHLFEGAFIATMKSGHIGVFRREQSHNLPIREIRLPSVAATMVQDDMDRQMRAFAIPIYEKELVRLLNLEMTRAGAR